MIGLLFSAIFILFFVIFFIVIFIVLAVKYTNLKKKDKENDNT